MSGPGHGEGEDASRLTADQLHYVEEGVEPGAAYTFTLMPVSTGYQEDITGPAEQVTVHT